MLAVFVHFVLSIICFFYSQGGFYLFNIFNDYSAAYSLFVVGALEMIIISWLYGTLYKRSFYSSKLNEVSSNTVELLKDLKNFFELSQILFLVGFSRFSEDFSLMLGRQAPMYFKICLQYAGPVIITVWVHFPSNANMFQWQVEHNWI